jgi:transportin-1
MMPPNVEFLISPLDLLSGIVQGLGPKIEPLIAQTNPPLLSLLGRCIHVSFLFIHLYIYLFIHKKQ